MSRLPPFDALIAFEAAARLGSMTRAAAELSLTQSAVSHRVRRLEAFMGVALLLRANPGLLLTSAGRLVFDGLADVLDGLADLRARCQASQTPDRLRVGVGAALADNWLGRRLPDFARTHPGLGIELVVVENEAPERATDLELRILWVAVDQAATLATQRALFRERVFPVCAPALLPHGFTAGDPGVLSRVPLLHKISAGYDVGEEWSWPAWFEQLGLPGVPVPSLRFGSIGPTIAAAIGGAGATLARSMLVHDALAEGRLVRLLPRRFDRLSAKVHVMRWPARLAGDPRIAAFASWLAAAAQQTRDAARALNTTGA